MSSRDLLLCFAVALLVPSTVATAQTGQLQVDLEYEVAAARALMEKERRIVLASELLLNAEERDAFWPLYNEYAEEITEVSEIRVQLIADYAANYDNMTDEFANRMLRDHFEFQSRRLKTQQKYLKRFKRVLPPTKVVRFYQVENKLDAIVNFNLASQIPMVQD